MTNDEDYRNFIEDAKSDKLNDLLKPTSYEGEFVEESGDFVHSLGSRKGEKALQVPPSPVKFLCRQISSTTPILPAGKIPQKSLGGPNENDDQFSQRSTSGI